MRLLVTFFLAMPVARADDWPRWRGVRGDGVSHELVLLREWPKDGPKRLWRSDQLGDGFSGVAVVGDRVYTLGAFGETEHAIALDAVTGQVAWSVPIGPRLKNAWGDGPRSTPTHDGNDLYVLGGSGKLASLDPTTGKHRWSVDLPAALGTRLMKGNIIDTHWGFCESPLVDS